MYTLCIKNQTKLRSSLLTTGKANERVHWPAFDIDIQSHPCVKIIPIINKFVKSIGFSGIFTVGRDYPRKKELE